MPRNNSPNIYFRIDQFRWNILKRQNADNIEEWLCPDFKQNIAIREGSPPHSNDWRKNTKPTILSLPLIGKD